MAIRSIQVLSQGQLATLAEHGEERTAAVGDVLFRVGDRRYPFIAILEGEAAIQDAAGHEIVRHGALRLPRRDEPALGPDRLPHRRRHGADALHRRRPRPAAPAAVRGRAAGRPAAVDLHGAARAPAAGGRRGRGDRAALVAGHPSTGRVRESHAAPPHLARRGARRERRVAFPLVRLPGGAGAAQPDQRRGLARARHRARARGARGGRPAGHRRRPGRPGRRGLRRLRGARHARGREHGARRSGRHVAPDRELPRLPGRHQRRRADQPRGHAGAQVQRAHGDPLPRAGARAGRRPPRRAARRRARGRGARGACWPRAPSTAACRSRGSRSTRASASSTPPDRPRRSAAAPRASA